MEPLTLAVVLFALSFLHGMVVEQWRERLAQARSGPGEGTAASYDSLTIIVPTRNAAGTLIPLLQDLHAQDLPKERVEVLVVDDHSEDDTAAVVHSMGLKWPELRCISNDGVGKKAAITTGVTHASGEVILLTDADARCGVSRASTVLKWMNAQGMDMALAAVRTEGDGLLGRIQEEEQAGLTGMAIGSALQGRPFLANGANMAFTRKAFAEVRGYQGDPYASGDDVFLVQRMKRAGKRIGYVVSTEAVVSVAAERTWGMAIQQRLRWAGKMRGVRGMTPWIGSLGLALPWALLLGTWQIAPRLFMEERTLEPFALLLLSWLLWCVPAVRLVREVKAFLSQRHSNFVAFLGLVLFSLYAPLIALLSWVVRPQWKGRKT